MRLGPSLESQAWCHEVGGLTRLSVITSQLDLNAFNIELSTANYNVVSLNRGGHKVSLPLIHRNTLAVCVRETYM